MVIKVEIIVVHDQNGSKIDVDGNIEDMLKTVTDVQICGLTNANPIETDITERLLLSCDENNSDLILIIGDIGFSEKRRVIEAVTNVIHSNTLSEHVAILISNIEMKLYNLVSNKFVYGIRNQTLIIDLSGLHKDPKDYFEAIADIIPEVISLIHMVKDQNLSLYVAPISNNSTMQNEANINLKRQKTSTSPVPPNNVHDNKRHKESFPMISLSDALSKMHKIISESQEKTAVEAVQVSDACGRILCENVEAKYDLPSYETAAEQGYAVLASDGKGLRKVVDVDDTPPSTPLKPGTCMRVKREASIPDGATAIVQITDTKLVHKFRRSNNTYIEIKIVPESGHNIHPVGYDLAKGQIVANSHERISSIQIALLSAAGRKEVLVAKQISIGVLSIGSNIQELENPLKPGFMYDANRITLISLLKEKNFHSLDFGIVDNELTPIQNKIEEALEKVDLLVTTGSTNDRDLLKIVLEQCKADIHFGNVNIKPGKSTIFATCKIDGAKKYLLCLSGNPTSAFICAQIFLLSLVNNLCGNFHTEYSVIPSVSMKQQYTLHSRARLAWTVLEWSPAKECALASSKGNTICDKLVSAAGANALLLLPEKGTATENLSDEKSCVPAFLVKLPKRYDEKAKNFCNAHKAPEKTHKI
ncbi:PREDICTED: gephyrin-like [Vollenhovia emeryi]|uniref:gephyrin-like n=1 Tax=Vollenhovia emeryi TaxID=411798 RepID=UPI0005F53777|nr:PREDICTED: gephyrin-like [Vollenhovia emeryi]